MDMMLIVISLAATLAVMYRVVHVIAAVDIGSQEKHPLRMLGLALHIALAGGGATLYVAGMVGGLAVHAYLGGLLLLVSLAMLTLIDRRTPK